MMRLLVVAILVLPWLAGCSSAPSKQEKRDADLAKIYTDMGVEYLRRGELDLARGRLEQALALNPDLADVHHYLATLYTRLEEYDSAEHHYQRALELNPNDPNLRNNFGVFLCGRHRLDEAEQHFLAAAKNSSYAAPQLAYENLAQCALRIPDAEKAESYFRRALAMDPKLPNSLIRMAKLTYDKRDFFKARAYYERYLAVGELSAPIVWLGVLIESQLSDKVMVAKYGETLVSRFPDSEEAKRYLKLDREKMLGKLNDGGKPLEVIVSDEVLEGRAKASTENNSSTPAPDAVVEGAP